MQGLFFSKVSWNHLKVPEIMDEWVMFPFSFLIQVLTRFLGSSSPVLYWFSAHLLHTHEPLLQNRDPPTSYPAPHLDEPSSGSCFPGWNRNENPVLRLLKNWRQSTALTQWILGYALSYWFLGLALHCNFFPWTWARGLPLASTWE